MNQPPRFEVSTIQWPRGYSGPEKYRAIITIPNGQWPRFFIGDGVGPLGMVTATFRAVRDLIMKF